MVNIFRGSEYCPSITKEAIKIGVNTIWMQLGIKSEEALELGKKNGKNIIMDKCPKMEHSRLSGALGLAGFNSNLVSSKRNVSNSPHLANVGDTKTLIVHPASTTHRQLNNEQKEKSGISDAMIRLSIGLENHKDLVEDLRGALEI